MNNLKELETKIKYRVAALSSPITPTKWHQLNLAHQQPMQILQIIDSKNSIRLLEIFEIYSKDYFHIFFHKEYTKSSIEKRQIPMSIIEDLADWLLEIIQGASWEETDKKIQAIIDIDALQI